MRSPSPSPRLRNFADNLTITDQEIDSFFIGNKMRFVNCAKETGKNGACSLTPLIKMCNMTARVGFFALRDIEIGEELFFNYGDMYDLLPQPKADEKATPAITNGRRNKKNLPSRRRNKADLTRDFAEPEYEPEEGKSGYSSKSKKVTPRFNKKAPLSSMAVTKRGKNLAGSLGSKTVDESGSPTEEESSSGSEDESEESEGDADEGVVEGEQEIIQQTVFGKRRRVLGSEDSDYEPEVGRRSGRAVKRRRRGGEEE